MLRVRIELVIEVQDDPAGAEGRLVAADFYASDVAAHVERQGGTVIETRGTPVTAGWSPEIQAAGREDGERLKERHTEGASCGMHADEEESCSR